MSEAGSGALVERITTFLQRMETLGPLLRRVAGRPMEIVIAIRGSERRVALDLRADPARVKVGGPELSGDLLVAASAEALDRALGGELGAIEGLATRTLLLSGGMVFLVRGLRVLRLAAPLYRDHRDGPARRNLRGRLVELQARAVAPRLGRALARCTESELVESLDALTAALLARSPGGAPAPAVGRVPLAGHPLEAPAEARRGSRARATLGAAGTLIGLAKYSLGARVDLFGIVERLSAGLAAGEGA